MRNDVTTHTLEEAVGKAVGNGVVTDDDLHRDLAKILNFEAYRQRDLESHMSGFTPLIWSSNSFICAGVPQRSISVLL